MRSSKIILALWLGASAWAQTAPPKPQAHPPVAAKPSPVQAPSPATAAKSAPAAPQAQKAAPQSPKTAPQAQKPAPQAKVPAVNATAKPPAQPATTARSSKPSAAAPDKAKNTTAETAKPRTKVVRRNVVRRRSAGLDLPKLATAKPVEPVIRGRRDPFVSPVVERVGNGVNCIGSGRKCLAVGDIILHGVVTSPSGLIAVVVNGEHTYFLREHDPLANGAVERITRDAIVLRERSSDALGRPLTREVTKRLGAPAA